jgi:hypothetical protein
MKIEQTTTVKLSPKEMQEAVIDYLYHKNILKKGQKAAVSFDVSKTREGEDLFSPGYETLNFDGCTVKY